MHWDNLLSGVRLRDLQVKNRQKVNKFDYRNDFEDDYSRLIFSPAVRRLQDKTQVFPLDDSDFVRTRLTHSHEVSAIARSIGISVEKKLIKDGILSEKHEKKISSLLAVVGLVHDLGNPPYGHHGEKAIQSFFKDWFAYDDLGKEIKKKLSPEQVADFENFEGNAQTFRLLTRLHNLIDSYGYNLSVASLASIIKYPRTSLEGNKKSQGASYEKFGYFQSEKRRFKVVQKFSGIGNSRHPVTFLLEAADDIAYLSGDLEDGCKKRIIDYQTIVHILEKNLKDSSDEEREILHKFKRDYKKNKIKDWESNPLDNAVQKLRINIQGYMISSVVKKFLEKEMEIRKGNFDEEILSVSKAANITRALKELSGIIFKDENILVLELNGEQVIQGLLELFTTAVLSEGKCDTRTHEGKLYQLISKSYRDIMDNSIKADDNDFSAEYFNLLLATDFICGMTDSYALELYRRLHGIKL